MDVLMGFGREMIDRKYYPGTNHALPEWLVQAKALPNRLFITESEKEVIDLIRSYGELTKGEIVLLTSHSRTKIATTIDSLLERHYVRENKVTEFSGGRRSHNFSLNGGLGLVAGIDIGATSIDLGIADFNCKIQLRHSEPGQVRQGPIKVLGRACTQLEKMLKDKGYSIHDLRGIGIGVPGPVDFNFGTVVSPPIMPGWDRYPIIQMVQGWFPSANVVVDNDVNVMALGEIHQGAAKGVSNLIFVKIGTGIGAGIICDGKIYRGACGCAGDIGHISVDKKGPLCHCGNNGCLEAVAAGPAIADRALAGAKNGKSPILMKYFENNGGFLRAENVGDAAREGDAFAIEVIRESGQYVGDVLASLVNFYNPGMIVIGGGVSNLGNLLLSSIRQSVISRSLPLATRDLQVVFSNIGPDAGVIGAVNLAMDYMFTQTESIVEE
jgi:glucokinase-like ROK family protein